MKLRFLEIVGCYFRSCVQFAPNHDYHFAVWVISSCVFHSYNHMGSLSRVCFWAGSKWVPLRHQLGRTDNSKDCHGHRSARGRVSPSHAYHLFLLLQNSRNIQNRLINTGYRILVKVRINWACSIFTLSSNYTYPYLGCHRWESIMKTKH